MNHIAVLIGQNLELNMSWTLYEVLNIHSLVAKRHLCFLLRRLKTVFKFFRRTCHTHPLPAAAEGCLDDDRITDLFRDLCTL